MAKASDKTSRNRGTHGLRLNIKGIHAKKYAMATSQKVQIVLIDLLFTRKGGNGECSNAASIMALFITAITMYLSLK